MNAYITGIGWVTAGGMGRAGDGAPFAMTEGALPALAPDAAHPASRRMDDFSRLGMAAIALALADAGLQTPTARRPIGIVAATEYGCLNTDIDYFDTVISGQGRSASPGLFSYTLPSVFLGEVAIRFGLTGPTFVINPPDWRRPACVETALNCISDGDATQMLCGICHPEMRPEFNRIRPVPPGALFFLIETAPAGRLSYGRIERGPVNRMTLDNRPIDDLAGLVGHCLAATRKMA